MAKLDDIMSSFAKNLKMLNVEPIKTNKIFYFDESNNIKKGIIGKDKDNNDDLENLYFVLGGIAVDKNIDFDELLKYVGARQIPTDAKFSFFAFKKNKFEEAISQSRLRKFFEYLLNNKILIHFDILHYMHFALTDILDSLIEEDDANNFAAMFYYKELQSDMTEVLYQDYDALHEILVNFEFPNVPKERANDFVNEIFDLYTRNYDEYNPDDADNFTKELLRQIIKAKKNKNNMLFLEDNKSFVISEGVFHNYLSRTLEIEDLKYFDNELSIINQLEELDAEYEKKLNVKFIDSANSREIQICDVVCGFVARLYNFLSHHEVHEIYTFIKNLNKEEDAYKTLKAFADLMTLSDNISPMMFKKTTPLFIEDRFTLFIKLMEK
ncbi:MAG: DUF3800 domain-containing protein [Bacilli bacterium]